MFQNAANITIGVNAEASQQLNDLIDLVGNLESAVQLTAYAAKGLDQVLGRRSALGKLAEQGAKGIGSVNKDLQGVTKNLDGIDKFFVKFQKIGKKGADLVVAYNKELKATGSFSKAWAKANKDITDSLNNVAKSSEYTKTAIGSFGDQVSKVVKVIEGFAVGLLAIKALDETGNYLAKVNAQLSRTNELLFIMQSSGFDVAVFDQLNKLTSLNIGNLQTSTEVLISSTLAYNDFNSALKQVGTVYKDLSIASDDPLSLEKQQVALSRFGSQIQDLVSNELKNAVTSAEALAASYQAISAGFVSAGDSSKVMEAGLKLAVGTGSDATASVELLSKTLNAYDLSADKAAETAAKLNAIVENGITTIPELSLKFGQTAGFAKTAGVALEDLGAALAVITSTGTGTQVALTGLESLFAGIIAGQYDQGLAQYGVSLNKATIESKGLVAALQDVNKALGNNKQKLQEVLSGDQLAFRTVDRLVGEQASKVSEIVDQIAKTTASRLEEIFDIKIDNDALLQFQQIVNKTSELLIKVGKILSESGIFENAFKQLEKVVNVAERNVDIISQWLPLIIKTNLGLKAFNTIIGLTIGLLTTLTGIYLNYRLITNKLIPDIGFIINAFTKYNLALNTQIPLLQKVGLLLGQLFGRNSIANWAAYNEAVAGNMIATEGYTAAVNRNTIAEGARIRAIALSKDITNEQAGALANATANTVNHSAATNADAAFINANNAARENWLKTTLLNINATIKSKLITESHGSALANNIKLIAANTAAYVKNTAVKLKNIAVTTKNYLASSTSLTVFGKKLKNLTLLYAAWIKDTAIKAKNTIATTANALAGKTLHTGMLAISGSVSLASTAWAKLTGIMTASLTALKAYGGLIATTTALVSAIVIPLTFAATAVVKFVTSTINANAAMKEWNESLNDIDYSEFVDKTDDALNGFQKFLRVLNSPINQATTIRRLNRDLVEIEGTINAMTSSSERMQLAYRRRVKEGLSSIKVTVDGTNKSVRDVINEFLKAEVPTTRMLNNVALATDEFVRISEELYKQDEKEVNRQQRALIALEKRYERFVEENNVRAADAMRPQLERLRQAAELSERYLELSKLMNERTKADFETLQVYIDRTTAKSGSLNKYFSSLKNQSEQAAVSLAEAQRQIARVEREDGIQEREMLISRIKQREEELSRLRERNRKLGDALTQEQIDEVAAFEITTNEMRNELANIDQPFTQFDDAAARFMDSINNMVEAGFISSEEARKRIIEGFTADQRELFSPEQEKAYQQALVQFELQGNQERLAILESQSAKYKSIRDSELTYSEEIAEKSLEIDKEMAKARLEQAEIAIKQLEKQGIFTREAMDKALADLAKAETDYTKLVLEQELERANIRNRARNKELELLKASQETVFGARDDFTRRIRENEEKNLKSVITGLESQLKTIQQQANSNIAKYENELKRNQEVLANSTKDLEKLVEAKEQEIADLEQDYRQALLKEEEGLPLTPQEILAKSKMEQAKKALDAFNTELDSIQQGFEAKQRNFDEFIKQEKANVTNAQAEIERDLQINRTRLLEFRRRELEETLDIVKKNNEMELSELKSSLWQRETTISDFNIAQAKSREEELTLAREHAEALLQIAKENGSELTWFRKNLADAEAAELQAKYKTLQSITAKALNELQAQITKIEIGGTIELGNNEKLLGLLEAQSRITESRSKLLADINTTTISSLERLRELEKDEDKRDKIAKQIADTRKVQLLNEIKSENSLAKIEQMRLKLTTDRAKIENQIAKTKQQVAIIEAQANEELLAADPTKTIQERQAAALQTQLAIKQLAALEQESVLLEVDTQLQQSAARVEEQLRDRRNRLALLEAELDVAQAYRDDSVGAIKDIKDEILRQSRTPVQGVLANEQEQALVNAMSSVSVLAEIDPKYTKALDDFTIATKNNAALQETAIKEQKSLTNKITRQQALVLTAEGERLIDWKENQRNNYEQFKTLFQGNASAMQSLEVFLGDFKDFQRPDTVTDSRPTPITTNQNVLLDEFKDTNKALTDIQRDNYRQYEQLLQQMPDYGRSGLVLDNRQFSPEFIDIMMRGNREQFDESFNNLMDAQRQQLLNLSPPPLPTLDPTAANAQNNNTTNNNTKVDIESPITINISSEEQRDTAEEISEQINSHLLELVDELNRRV